MSTSTLSRPPDAHSQGQPPAPPETQQQTQQSSTASASTSASATNQQPSQQSTNLRRGPWSPDEDRKLLDSINLYGATNWVRISQALGTRTPKQCRERYHQNLKPSLNRNPISAEEGQLIEELVAKYGKRWAEIARHLNGRSDNAIKNWWNGGTNRRRRASSQAILQETHRDVHHLQPLEYHPQMSYQLGPHQAPVYGYPPQPAFNTAIFQQQQTTSAHSPPPPPQALPPHMVNGGPPPQHQPLPPHQTIPPGMQQPLPPHQALPPHQLAPHQLPPQAQQQPQPPQQQQQQQQLPPQQMLPPLNPSRSSSINQELFTQQAGVKRFLEEQHLPARRHSAQTILTSTNGSSSPFSSAYSRGGSSRNSSVSFDWSSNTALNSQSNSRRSSLVHELFPNPLGHQSSKRQNSYSSTYLSPKIQSQRGSTAGIPPVPLHLTMTPPVAPASQEKPVFKSEFSFKPSEPVKLPPPSAIASNPAFTPSGVLNRKEDEEKEDGEEEKEKVMNISNLLG